MIDKILQIYNTSLKTSNDYIISKTLLMKDIDLKEKEFLLKYAISKGTFYRYLKHLGVTYYTDLYYQLNNEKKLFHQDINHNMIIMGDEISTNYYLKDELSLLVDGYDVHLCTHIEDFAPQNDEYIIYVNHIYSIYSMMGNELYESFVYETMLKKRKTLLISREGDIRIKNWIWSQDSLSHILKNYNFKI